MSSTPTAAPDSAPGQASAAAPRLPRGWLAWLPLALLPAILAVIWSIAWLVIDVQRSELLAVLEKQQAAAAEGLARRIDHDLSLYQDALGRLAREIPAEVLADPDALQAYLSSRDALRALFDDALVAVSPDGRVLASDPPLWRGLDVRHREYYQATRRRGEAVVGRPFLANRTKEPVVPVTAPRFGPDGELALILAGGVSLTRSNFLAALPDIPIGRTGYFFATTDAGQVIAHPQLAPMAQLELAGELAPGQFVAAGEEGGTLLTLAALNQGQWLLGVAFPLREALEPVAELNRQVLIAAGVLSLLAVWITLSFRRGVSQLAQSETRYRSLSRLSSDWFWELDQDLRLRTLHGPPGRSTASFVGTVMEDLPLAAGQEAAVGRLHRALQARQPFYRLVLAFVVGEGVVHLALSGEPIWRRGAFAGYRGTATDVSAEKRAEQAVREANLALERRVDERTQALVESRERLGLAVQAGGIGLWDWDIVTDTVSLHRPDGRPAPPRKMADLLARVHPEDQARVQQRLAQYLDNPEQVYENEYRYQRADGSYAWALTRGRTQAWDERGRPTRMTGVVQDITERKLAEQRVEYMAHYDALTGLPNRVLFEDRVVQAIGHARRDGGLFALLFLDLDHFKNVNDALGHQVGDALLQAVSRRVGQVLREVDTLSRQGGDEFLVLAPRLRQPEDAGVIAEKLLEVLRQPFSVAGHELQLSASIGIACYPGDGADVSELIKHADVAMYQSKNTGRNGYHYFTRSMDERVAELVTISNELRVAMEQGHFHLVYQPQVDIGSGRVTGAEALLRWEHPQRGAISPAVFIPIAEDTGQILQLGEWVLRTVIEQLRRWEAQGLEGITVSVNLSARQFRQANLADYLRRLLDGAGVPAQRLELEITESALVGQAEATLAALHRMGCTLAIDDFGTGYSNLRYLKRFHIDKLKIDQCFVRDVPGDPEDVAIVEAIIGLGRAMDMTVLAEGVETAEQLSFLSAQGCDQVQGFYFSRPLPVPAFTKLLAGERRLRVEAV